MCRPPDNLLPTTKIFYEAKFSCKIWSFLKLQLFLIDGCVVDSSETRLGYLLLSFGEITKIVKWSGDFWTVFCPYVYPQLIQLQSYNRQRKLYFKVHLGLQNCFITEICSWHFWLILQTGPSVTPLIWTNLYLSSTARLANGIRDLPLNLAPCDSQPGSTTTWRRKNAD